jgi:tripartite-type tricarboxylate transporter receptor subunit TctC
MFNRTIAKCAVLAAALLLPALVSALYSEPASAQQAYPTRPIRLIVPYPPGGPTDIIGRTINDRLGKRLGQQVIVDNRSGAATVIGAEIAAHSPADGYTLLLATITTLAVNPALKSKLPYDPERDFAPVSMLAAQPYLLVVHPGVPAISVSQLIAHAKAQPGKLSFASAGVGAGAHLAAELFKYMAHIDVVHIPYKGSGPAMTDVMGGQCAYMFAGISAAYPHTLSGKLNALAVSTAKRSAAVPEIPTISESGLPGYQMNTWNSLVVPRGTPAPIIHRLNTEVVAVLNEPEVKERMKQQAIDPDPGTPAQLAAHIKSEVVRFDILIKTIGLKPE